MEDMEGMNSGATGTSTNKGLESQTQSAEDATQLNRVSKENSSSMEDMEGMNSGAAGTSKKIGYQTLRPKIFTGMPRFRLYDGVGYLRPKPHIDPTIFYFCCINPSCRGRAMMKKPLTYKALLILTNPHDHPPMSGSRPVLETPQKLPNLARKLKPPKKRETAISPKEVAKKEQLKTKNKEKLNPQSLTKSCTKVSPDSVMEEDISDLSNTLAAAALGVKNSKNRVEKEDVFESDSIEQRVLPAEIHYGLRKRSLMVYDGVGYLYHKKGEGPNKIYLICENRSCKGNATVETPLVDGALIFPSRPHDHPPNPGKKVIWEVRKKMQERAVTETTRIKTIYLEEIAKIPKDLAVNLREISLISSLSKLRKAHASELKKPDNNKVTTPPKGPSRIVKLIKGQTPPHRTIFDGVGYYYHRDRLSQNHASFRCIYRHCKGRCVTALPITEGARIILTRYHSHKIDPLYFHVLELKHCLLQRASNELTPLATMYAEESAKYPKEVGKRLNFVKFRPLMHKRQKSSFQIDYQPLEAKGVKRKYSDYFKNPELCKRAQVFPGERESSCVVHDGEGYFYHRDRKSKNMVYIRCITRACPGRGALNADGSMIETVQRHNHAPDPSYLPVLELKTRIIERSAKELTPWEVIYKEECAKVPKEVVKQLKYSKPGFRARKKLDQVFEEDNNDSQKDLDWFRVNECEMAGNELHDDENRSDDNTSAAD